MNSECLHEARKFELNGKAFFLLIQNIPFLAISVNRRRRLLPFLRTQLNPIMSRHHVHRRHDVYRNIWTFHHVVVWHRRNLLSLAFFLSVKNLLSKFFIHRFKISQSGWVCVVQQPSTGRLESSDDWFHDG